jgi:hypothetical protein
MISLLELAYEFKLISRGMVNNIFFSDIFFSIHIGFKSNELLQIACIEPFTQTQLQPAQLDIENTEAKIRKIIFFI